MSKRERTEDTASESDYQDFQNMKIGIKKHKITYVEEQLDLDQSDQSQEDTDHNSNKQEHNEIQGENILTEIPQSLVLSLQKTGPYAHYAILFEKAYGVLGNEVLSGTCFSMNHEDSCEEASQKNESGTCQLEACVPVAESFHVLDHQKKDLEEQGIHIQTKTIPAMVGFKVVHKGPYDQIGSTYRQAFNFLTTQGYSYNRSLREYYLNQPQTVPPQDLLTECFIPCQLIHSNTLLSNLEQQGLSQEYIHIKQIPAHLAFISIAKNQINSIKQITDSLIAKVENSNICGSYSVLIHCTQMLDFESSMDSLEGYVPIHKEFQFEKEDSQYQYSIRTLQEGKFACQVYKGAASMIKATIQSMFKQMQEQEYQPKAPIRVICCNPHETDEECFVAQINIPI